MGQFGLLRSCSGVRRRSGTSTTRRSLNLFGNQERQETNKGFERYPSKDSCLRRVVFFLFSHAYLVVVLRRSFLQTLLNNLEAFEFDPVSRRWLSRFLNIPVFRSGPAVFTYWRGNTLHWWVGRWMEHKRTFSLREHTSNLVLTCNK